MITRWVHEPSGLDAYLCIDDPDAPHVAGGIRTWTYSSAQDAITDARDLARAMTIKCALAGVDAGGAKTVVRADLLHDRPGAFHELGQAIEQLDGRYLAAGDLGTTSSDLAQVQRATRFVRTDESFLAECVARSVLVSLDAMQRVRGTPIDSWCVGVRGCGAIGSAVAHALQARGAQLVLEDLDDARASALAEQLNARAVPCGALNAQSLDVLCPCGPSRDLDALTIKQLSAWGICGAANNILVDDAAANAVVERSIDYVPDVIASSGAVLQGVAETLMGLSNTDPLFEQLSETAYEVLTRSRSEKRPGDTIAIEIAGRKKKRRP